MQVGNAKNDEGGTLRWQRAFISEEHLFLHRFLELDCSASNSTGHTQTSAGSEIASLENGTLVNCTRTAFVRYAERSSKLSLKI